VKLEEIFFALMRSTLWFYSEDAYLPHVDRDKVQQLTTFLVINQLNAQFF